MSQQDIQVGVDVGTANIKVVVADVSGEKIRIAALCEQPALGVVKGIIEDVAKTTKPLEDAVAFAEKVSGIPIKDAFVNIAGIDVKSILCRGSLVVSRNSHRVTEWDVLRVLEIARENEIPKGMEVACVVPRRFFVDGESQTNPIGVEGQLLEVEAVLIIAPKCFLQQRRSLMERLGLELSSFNFSAVASAGAVLGDADKGVAVIDIGASLTDIAIFDNHGLCWIKSLPIGGEYITNDIAFGLQITKTEAENLKLKHGTLIPAEHGENLLLSVSSVSEERRVNRQFLTEIVESRVIEILQMVKQSILTSGYHQVIERGLIFTGGVTNTPGFVNRAAEYLKVPVRTSIGLYNDPKMSIDPVFTCAVGLIMCSLTGEHLAEPSSQGSNENLFDRFLRFLKEIF